MFEEITPEEIKNRITPAMRTAAKNYSELKAAAAKVRAQIDAEQLKIILANDFRYAEDDHEARAGQRITTVKDAWLMSDADFQKYSRECDKMHKRLGFQVEAGYCPALIAEDKARNARRNLIDVCQPILLGMTYEILRFKIAALEQVTGCLLKLLK